MVEHIDKYLGYLYALLWLSIVLFLQSLCLLNEEAVTSWLRVSALLHAFFEGVEDVLKQCLATV